MLIPTLVIFGNWWIWRIVHDNFLLGVLIIAATVALYKNYKKLFVLLFILLLFFQYTTTEISSLTKLSNDDVRVKDMRLREYPYNLVRVGHWIEERPESIALSRIVKNFSEVIDPNLYFFGNHPRERVGFTEFEKFHFIALPFYIIGLFKLVEVRISKIMLFSASAPLILISFIGQKNFLGPFSLFPFISLTIIYGIRHFVK